VAITYVLDGYNLMHAMGLLAGKVNALGLARARLQFQEFLVSAFGADAGQVTVVFDAARAPPKVARQQTYKGLILLLAVGELEADDLIETLITEHSSPRHLAVVSNDHRLQRAARHKGAQPMSCAEFLDLLDRRRQKKLPVGGAPEKQEHLSEKEIGNWLQEFAGLEDVPDLKEAFELYDFEIED
jgi:predicted RNA-binding protein with PIN domain